jgi:hypothetical protein
MSDEKMREAVYVVQKRRDMPTSESEAWTDIATVTVPARTHRKTVIEKALGQAGVTETNGAIFVRVLDAESARESKVETEQPPPRLKIG